MDNPKYFYGPYTNIGNHNRLTFTEPFAYQIKN